MSHFERVASHFDGESARWRELYAHEDVFATIHRQRREWGYRTVIGLNSPPGTVVLDAGVGAGGLAARLAEDGLRVVGVDGSRAMLDETRRTAREGGVPDRVLPLQGDVTALPFHDGAFPVVVALGLLPWVADAGQALRELARVTRPGGHLVVNADNPRRLIHLDPRINPYLARPRRAVATWLGRPPPDARPRGQTVRGIRRLVADAGLELVYARPLGFGPFTLAGRPVMSVHSSRVVNDTLQRLADRGTFGLRSTGCMHLVLARRPEEPRPATTGR